MYDRLQGVLNQPIGEGTHFRVPWFQTPNVMDIRTRPRSISSVTGTKGSLTLQPRFFIIPSDSRLHRTWVYIQLNTSFHRPAAHLSITDATCEANIIMSASQICRW